MIENITAHQATCQSPGCGHTATWCVTSPIEHPSVEHYDVCSHHRGAAVTSIDSALSWRLHPVVTVLADTPEQAAAIRTDAAERLASLDAW